MTHPRIGFVCQYKHPERLLSASALKAFEGPFNPRTTTLRWMDGVTPAVARDKLVEIVTHNLAAQLRLLAYVAELPPMLRMLRLSSDLLPFYSHPKVAHVYTDPAIERQLVEGFAAIGELARASDIRLSFHPGQYCVLGSENPGVVENSLAEFEYHADMIRMMGYGRRFQDLKCNVHIAGRLGVEGTRAVWSRLSQVARNCITFENDEKTYGLDHCLQVADLAPVVLDIHHCWIHENHYIDPHSSRVAQVIDSWRGVRPTLHYSQPQESLQAMGFDAEHTLEMDALLQVVSKRDLTPTARKCGTAGPTITRWNFSTASTSCSKPKTRTSRRWRFISTGSNAAPEPRHFLPLRGITSDTHMFQPSGRFLASNS